MPSRLAIGTVQFGLPYGIANRVGQVSREDAATILTRASMAGVDTLDTAISYGTSEQLLGEIGVRGWKVISKLPAIPEARSANVAAWVSESVHDSLERLKVPRLSGLLIHHSHQLLGPYGDAIYMMMTALKDQGKVDKIGVSIYSPHELDAVWPHFQADLVQAPFNIMDRRLATSGWLTRLHEAGVEIHIRSIFLQGLLLMENSNRPPIFRRWQPLWDEWQRWLNDQSLTPLQACLSFALSRPEVTRIVVGIDSLKQLQEILSCVEEKFIMPPATLICQDEDLINPSHWKAI